MCGGGGGGGGDMGPYVQVCVGVGVGGEGGEMGPYVQVCVGVGVGGKGGRWDHMYRCVCVGGGEGGYGRGIPSPPLKHLLFTNCWPRTESNASTHSVTCISRA